MATDTTRVVPSVKFRVDTGLGTNRLTIVPSPHWHEALSPHTYRVPSVSTYADVFIEPPPDPTCSFFLYTMAPSKIGTGVYTLLDAYMALPTWPMSFFPNATILFF